MARIEKLVMFGIALAVAVALGFFIGRNNARSEVAWLKDEVARYASEAILSSAQQAERAKQVIKLAEQVSGYELELANGVASHCVADPAYDVRLRKILETGRQPASGG